MAHVFTFNDIDETVVAERLAREFPQLPARIISQVVHAYHLEISNLSDAARAARARLRDACSTG